MRRNASNDTRCRSCCRILSLSAEMVPGSRRISASSNSMVSVFTNGRPWCRAHNLPLQPGSRARPLTMVRFSRPGRQASATVASPDRSLTRTIPSPRPCAAMELRVSAMTPASFLAGISTVTSERSGLPLPSASSVSRLRQGSQGSARIPAQRMTPGNTSQTESVKRPACPVYRCGRRPAPA